MTEFYPVPDREKVDGVRRRWRESTDTFDRVYSTVLGVTKPTPYTEIAQIADCSPNAAKKHLDRLTEVGIARADPDVQPVRYERNEGYLEWQEASRIADLELPSLHPLDVLSNVLAAVDGRIERTWDEGATGQ